MYIAQRRMQCFGEGKRPLGRPRRRLEGDIKTGLHYYRGMCWVFWVTIGTRGDAVGTR